MCRAQIRIFCRLSESVRAQIATLPARRPEFESKQKLISQLMTDDRNYKLKSKFSEKLQKLEFDE